MNGLASITPDQTHALVVGIESYAGGPALNLDGPANDAYQFVRWLQGHGVPDENIILLVSPLEKNLGQFRDLGGIDCSLKPVTQEVVEQALKKLRQKHGLLILFWSGHGIMTADDETRRPLLANYSEDDKHNLNLNSLRVHLRASEFGYPENQFILVDTCAVEFDERSNREKLPDTEFGRKGKSGDCNQYIIFSTENRNAAENLTSERTGLFFKELMEVLRPEAALAAGYGRNLRRTEGTIRQKSLRLLSSLCPAFIYRRMAWRIPYPRAWATCPDTWPHRRKS